MPPPFSVATCVRAFALLTAALLLSSPWPLTPTSALPVQLPSRPGRVAKIAVLHMFDSVHFFQRLGHLTGENKRRYARRHGYDMVLSTPQDTTGVLRKVNCHIENERVVSGPDADGVCWADDVGFDIDHSRAPTFGKIKLALASCSGRQEGWLLWLDADAMIVNQSVPLESIIDDEYDLILTYDWLMLNAGILLIKCSAWMQDFLARIYNSRDFDSARALDQSSLQEHLDNLTVTERRAHVKVLPKHAMNVYTEEYRPGDFLLHMAGKLYESTEPGLFAIANQFDILSMVDDFDDVRAFFHGQHLLNYYCGLCPVSRRERQKDCKPQDERRIILNESLGSMSTPNRYRHVGLRYYWLGAWKDKYDVPGWEKKLRPLAIVSKESRTNTVSMKHPPPPPASHAGSADDIGMSVPIPNAARFDGDDVHEAPLPDRGAGVPDVAIDPDLNRRGQQHGDDGGDDHADSGGLRVDEVHDGPKPQGIGRKSMLLGKKELAAIVAAGIADKGEYFPAEQIGEIVDRDADERKALLAGAVDTEEEEEEQGGWPFFVWFLLIAALGVLAIGAYVVFKRRSKVSSKRH